MYTNKYLKYKKKYIELKGGSLSLDTDNIQFKYFEPDLVTNNYPNRFKFFYINNKLELNPEDTISKLFDYCIEIYLNPNDMSVLNDNNIPDPKLFIQLSIYTQNDITHYNLKKVLLKKVMPDIINNVFNNTKYNELYKNQLAYMINQYILATYPKVINEDIILKVWNIDPKLFDL